MQEERSSDREECEMDEAVDSPIKITKKMFSDELNLQPLKMSTV
jgi:hypothetical protein